MAIQFRRSALCAGIAALFASAFSAWGADVPQVKVTVNDKQCEPMTLTVNSGKTQFIIQNHSQKALEWEILKGVMVVEERENIAPGFTQMWFKTKFNYIECGKETKRKIIEKA